VTSPNEPGYPRAADGSANGSASDDPETGSLGNAIGRDVPPWQRGPGARAAQNQSARSQREPNRPEPHRGSGGQSGHASGADARLNRFISGGSAAQETVDQPSSRAEAPRNEPVVNEAYASELPDLSGAMARPPQRMSAPERSEPPARAATRARVQVAGRTQSGPVRASMQIRRIDPWSALKVSLVLSVALFFVWMIAVAFLYLVLGGMGVWSKLNSNVGDLLTSAGGQSGGELVSSGTIFGGAALIGLVNIVLMTAMATVGVFIYNLTTDLVGGVEVTLADRD
jgi:Transmembrane domain of unknown function (DUF3566)